MSEQHRCDQCGQLMPMSMPATLSSLFNTFDPQSLFPPLVFDEVVVVTYRGHVPLDDDLATLSQQDQDVLE